MLIHHQLYAIGGFDGENRLSSMECYHPENNEWTDMPSMKYSRSGAGVAVLNQVSCKVGCLIPRLINFYFIIFEQYIYVVGGFDGTRQLSSVERFDTDNKIWETITPMKTSRSALSVNVIDGKVYAMVQFCMFCSLAFWQ